MSDRIKSYFVSDPDGNYLAPTYDTYRQAQDVADEMNDEHDEHEGAFLKGNYVVGAHLADGTSTFEIG